MTQSTPYPTNKEEWIKLLKMNVKDFNSAHHDYKSDKRAAYSGVPIASVPPYRLDLTGADLTGANLTFTDLTGADNRADLAEVDLTGADLTGANLSKANLEWAILERANLSQANLEGAILTYANLDGASCNTANFKNAILGGASINNTDFTEATFEGVDLTHVQADPQTPPIGLSDFSKLSLPSVDTLVEGLEHIFRYSPFAFESMLVESPDDQGKFNTKTVTVSGRTGYGVSNSAILLRQALERLLRNSNVRSPLLEVQNAKPVGSGDEVKAEQCLTLDLQTAAALSKALNEVGPEKLQNMINNAINPTGVRLL